MTTRGSYNFDTGSDGRLLDHDGNLERFRALLRDDALIRGQWGPGDPGDFDHGSWHILCHLAGGSGVLRTRSGIAWCGITHRVMDDTYEASLIWTDGHTSFQEPLQSGPAKAVLTGAEPLGFIEGSSLGRISARGINDAPTAFNNWPRQKFDQPVDSELDGGIVWEHWSTTRDIRPSSVIGTSVLRAYLELLSVLGGRFAAVVARGRREHSHPEQLVALVKAGVLTSEEAYWDILPDPIPLPTQRLLYQSEPAAWLAAAQALSTSGPGKYHMFARRIDRWSRTADVRRDLGL